MAVKVPAMVCVEELKEKKTGSWPLCVLRRYKDSRAGGADEVVGIVVGEVPSDQPWTLPLINGRIPWYRVKLSAQRFENLLQNKHVFPLLSSYLWIGFRIYTNSLLHNPCGLTRTLMKERRKQENKLSLLSPTRATTSVSSISSSVSQGGDLEHLHQNNWALEGAKFWAQPQISWVRVSLEVVQGWKSKILLSPLGNIMQPNI